MENSSFGLKGLDELIEKGMNVKGLSILPLISNPALEDSDFDGISDMIDDRPSKEDIVSIDDALLDENDVISYCGFK